MVSSPLESTSPSASRSSSFSFSDSESEPTNSELVGLVGFLLCFLCVFISFDFCVAKISSATMFSDIGDLERGGILSVFKLVFL